ncbi:2,3,4,5-tetrahydropyridine-2,6-dicarboxylate N-acetyltransferase [Comamonadaceae bacterium OS-1]|nr:2,3,4,5-tetrahydropyridine-2,6-dicarboxylate N-acetyltransferase [Comamonadaceae bacterium OS-1]
MISRLKFFLRRMGFSKKNIICHRSSFVDEDSTLEGDNFLADSVTMLNCSLGAFSYLNSHCFVSNSVIGRYTCIGREVLAGLGRHPTNRKAVHRMFYSNEIKIWKDYFFESDFSEHAPITIGNDVWIGARSIIMDGVTIGDGAVIAAGSIVTHDVKPYSIVGGCPAKLIRYRFSPESCEYLLELKWWNLTKDELKMEAKNGIFNKITL